MSDLVIVILVVIPVIVGTAVIFTQRAWQTVLKKLRRSIKNG